MNNSTSRIGSSGSAKSTAAVQDTQRWIGNAFVDLHDPQGDTADLLLERIEGRYRNVIVDDLTRLDRVVPLSLITVSTAENTLVREKENNHQIHQLLEILGRQLEVSLLDQPMKRFYTEQAIKLWMSLKPEIRELLPFFVITELMRPHSPWCDYLISQCTDPTIRNVFTKAKTLHESTRLSTLGSAERLMDSFLGAPEIKARCTNQPSNLKHLVENKFVRITKGGPGVTKEAFRIVCAIRSIETMQFADENPDHNIRIIFEEYANYGLCGEPEIRGLNTLRKRGVSFDFISQSPPKDEFLREAIDQNCGVRIAHRCASYETAEYVAKWLLGNLDPHKVHHTTERLVQDGYDQVQRTSRTAIDYDNDRITTSEGDRARYKVVEDIHYQTLSDQQTLQINEIQNGLKVGERFVNDNGRLRKEYVPLPRPRYPWKGIAEERIRRWLGEMRRGQFYVTPNIELPTGLLEHRTAQGQRKRGNNGKQKSSGGMKRTPAP